MTAIIIPFPRQKRERPADPYQLWLDRLERIAKTGSFHDAERILAVIQAGRPKA